MKIAFITPFPPYRGGISKHSENLFNDFIKKNPIDIINFKRLYPNILFPGKTQYQSIKKNTKSYRIIDSINPFSWYKTYKLIKGNYDRLIIRYWHPFLIPAYYTICKLLKKNIKDIKIYAICDNALPHESFILQRKLLSAFLHNLDGLFVMSNKVEDEIKSIVNKIKIKKIYLPIVSDLGELLSLDISRKTINLDEGKLTFLFFGLIREYKGLDIFLEALNLINSNLLKQIQVLVVGECYGNINNYKNLINNHNINIKWIDEYVPDDNINLYFSSANYVVVPYKQASQSGIIPMAYHFNKPVIASDVYGIKEYIIENKTGHLFQNGNIKALAELLNDIIINNKKKDYSKIISYKNQFSTQNLVNLILEFIK